MLNRKLIFALIVLIMAVSSVCASDSNTSDDGYYNSNQESISQNASDFLVTQPNGGVEFDDEGSDVLSSGQTVYFDASASSDGAGTKSSPYKYLKSERVPSGGTAYFADGLYEVDFKNSFSSDVKLIGQSKANTIIRSSYSGFNFQVNSNSGLFIRDLTLENVHVKNYANFECSNVNFIYSKSASVSGGNKFKYDGGAISCDSQTSGATLKLNNCHFENYNGLSGGVIYAKNADITLTGCIFYNSTSTSFGGVVYAYESQLTVSKSSFRKSNAEYGGVLYLEKTTANLADSNFTFSESYSYGGIISAQNSHIVSSNCNYLNYKSSTDAGGAIYIRGMNFGSLDLQYERDLIITKSSFCNGKADFGGAICILSARLDVCDSYFRNNSAKHYGGCIFISKGSTSYINSSRFVDSNARSGGAIYSIAMNYPNALFFPAYLYITDNEFENVAADQGTLVFISDRFDSVVASGNKCDGEFDYTYRPSSNENVFSASVVPVINYVPESSTNIPSSYDSRDYGYVTVAKNQAEGGNCWAFAAISTLETCLKKATGITFDLSEENVKNIMACYSLYGGSSCHPNEGGFSTTAISYFANWFGPIEESDDVYDDDSALSALFYPLFNIQNVYFLPERSSVDDNDAIKKAIMDYGAVAASYSNFGDPSIGHAISIVGWDDNYNDMDYFGNYAQGAWIIKNSWGENWKDNGCTYISYEKEFKKQGYNCNNMLYTFIFKDTEAYVRNYEYDLGFSTFVRNSGETSYKNTFTSVEDEYLSAFSTYFFVPTDYTVSLYVDGTLKLTQSGHSLSGYFTIPFNTKTKLSKGDQFTIVITLKNKDYNYVPICYASDLNIVPYKNGVSYINVGNGWKSLFNEYSSTLVACIKAFTTPLVRDKVTISADEISTVILGEEVTLNFKLNDAKLSGGFVTVMIDGKTYYARVLDGKASLNTSFNDLGAHAISAYYKTNFHDSNTVSFNFNVVRKLENLVISAPDFTKYYGSTAKFSIRVTQNGKAVSGAAVKFIQGTNTQTVTTNSNGYAYVNINLAPGSYNVTSQYGGYSVSSNITVLSTISVKGFSYYYGEEYLQATFYNTDGSPLSNTVVKFKVENDVYSVTTDSNGVAKSNSLGLNANMYFVTAVNPINGEEKSYLLDVMRKSPGISLTYAQSNGLVTLTAILTPNTATGNVIFTVGGNLVNFTKKISNGKATLTLNLTDGNYPAYATYEGDSNLKSAKSSSITLKVSSVHDFVLTANDLTKHYGSSTIFSIRLTDNGNAVSGASVKFIRGTSIQTLTTNSNGFAYVDVDWASGTYNVKVEYGGKSVSSKITVLSSISVSDLNYDYGSSKVAATFYNSAGSALSGKEIKFIIGSTDYLVNTDSQGYATYSVKLNPGTYDVTAVNKNTGEEKKFKLTVRKITPTVSLTYTQSGESVTFTASLSPSDAAGKIVFTVGETPVNYTRTISGGKATLSLTLNDGNHKAYATYMGNTYYNSAKSATKTVSVTTSHNYVLTANDLTKYYGSSTRFSIKLTDNGKAVSGASIKFTKGIITQTFKTDTKGFAYVNASWAPGTYNVKIKYDNISVSSKITVLSTISVSDLTYDYGSSKVAATFYNSAGSALSGKEMKFIIGSTDYLVNTDSQGYATYSVKLNPGTYNVTAVNKNTGEEKKFKLTIKKVTPSLTLKEVEIDGLVAVKAILSQTSATGNIIFTFENKDYTASINDGVSSLRIDRKSGTYVVKVRYTGDSRFNAVSNSIKVTINKFTTSISVNYITKVYGDSKKLLITVKDNNGNPVSDDILSVDFYDEILDYYDGCFIKTNSKGQAFLSCNFVPGYYYVEVSDDYSQDSSYVVVYKATSKISAASKTFKVKTKTKKYTMTLKNSHNKVLKNKKVTLKVKGVKYTAKTNKYGKATFKITKLAKKGKFNAVVSFAGDAYYKKVSRTVKIKVK